MEEIMLSTESADTAALIAERALMLGLRIGCAESLTSGAIASRLGAARNAAEWFAGGVVAYDDDVKFQLLKVKAGPVVTARCATEMAIGATALLRVHHAVAVTGVGGPDPLGDIAPGTVFIGLATGSRGNAIELHLSGSPKDVVDEATFIALRMLLARIGGGEHAVAPPRGESRELAGVIAARPSMDAVLP
jgi:nicotinamide-nucleotide amidase